MIGDFHDSIGYVPIHYGVNPKDVALFISVVIGLWWLIRHMWRAIEYAKWKVANYDSLQRAGYDPTMPEYKKDGRLMAALVAAMLASKRKNK